MTEPLHEEGKGTRRTYAEKQQLLIDLAMLFFGGLIRLLKRRAEQ